MIGKVNDLLGDLFVAFHSHRRTSAQPATEDRPERATAKKATRKLPNELYKTKLKLVSRLFSAARRTSALAQIAGFRTEKVKSAHNRSKHANRRRRRQDEFAP